MFDLTTARSRLGLLPSDSSQDALITNVLLMAKQFAETYCDRKFDQATETAKFPYFWGATAQVKRYPLKSVDLISGVSNQGLVPFRFDATSGLVMFTHMVSAEELEITYTGGYAPNEFPLDLEMALWLLFDVAYQKMSAVYDKDAGGAVKSIASSGTSVTYFAAGDSGVGGPGTGIGLADPTVISILDFYRLEKA
jgi:hypothetical protein